MADLDARYGRRRPLAGWARAALVVAGVGLLVLAVVAVFLLWRSGQPEVRSRLLSYAVADDALVTARIEVVKPADRAAVCDVVAQAEDTSVVGRASVDVADDAARVLLEVDVETTSRALLAKVDGCRLG